MLSEAQLSAIFATKENRKRAKQGKGRAFIRTDNGLESEVISKMGDYDLGQHQGNVGTMRRSRKGATRRLPNGRRYYVAHDYDHDAREVVAYRLK